MRGWRGGLSTFVRSPAFTAICIATLALGVGANTAIFSMAGLAIGLAGSFALTRLISSMLFDVEPTDPLTFAVVSATLLVIGLSRAGSRRGGRCGSIRLRRYARPDTGGGGWVSVFVLGVGV